MSRGGVRPGAGRPRVSEKKQSVVIRVSESRASFLKEVDLLSDDDYKRVFRSIHGSDRVQSISREHQLLEEIHQLEKDFDEEVYCLRNRIKELESAQNNSFETKYNQLTKELYPALARLRELVPEERW